MTYDTMETGADSRVAVNLTSGNGLWTKTPVSVRGRGLSTFVRLTYNSLEPSGFSGNYAMAGRGVSVQASGLTRLNEPLDVTNAATQIGLTDGDGTRHVFTRTLDGGKGRGHVSCSWPGALSTSSTAKRCASCSTKKRRATTRRSGHRAA